MSYLGPRGRARRPRPMGLGAVSRVGMNLASPVLYGKPGSIDTPGSGIIVNPALPQRRGGGGSGGDTPALLLQAQVAPNLLILPAQVAPSSGGYGTNTKPPNTGGDTVGGADRNSNRRPPPTPTGPAIDPVTGALVVTPTQILPPTVGTDTGAAAATSSVGTATGAPTAGSSGGGGGGGELDLTPDDPGVDLDTSSSSASSFVQKNKWWLLAAAAVAAYAYSKRKKRRT